MTTYQTPGELGVSFYNGSQTYNSANAPSWAVRLIEGKVPGETDGAYAGGHKDCLNLVGTGENGVAVAARVALSFAYAGIVEDMALVYDTDLDESYDDDDPRRLYPFVKKLCPDCYEEAIALFEQDMAKYGKNHDYGSGYIEDYLQKVGDPVGMKCVYYELEQGDTYAGVMIHSSARPFTITLIVSVQNDVIGTYDVHYSAGIDGYDIEEECGEYDINSDPTGSNQFARAVEEYNRTCKKLNQVIGDQEMLVTYVNSRIEASYTYEQVQADNAKQATERVEIEQRF